MKKKLSVAGCLLFVAVCFSQNKLLPIIPKPQSIEFRFTDRDSNLVAWLNFNSIVRDSFGYFSNEVGVFNSQLLALKGFSIKDSVITKHEMLLQDIFRLYINPVLSKDEDVISGSYEMTISQGQIIIKGGLAGIQNGFSSLIQLMAGQNNKYPTFRLMTIKDHPRYSWRGMHLDCSRHFFSKEEVKKYLDYLALYKFNVFHWHLCDDQGWRIEIKKYPLLTSIGSIRKETVIGKQSDKAKGDGKPYGGFYSQEDIKEIVEYATARHITIVPEIEMPGHSLAALSAYPQYSCTGGKFSPATTWGVFDDVYCAGNDSTFIFLENILSEVCELFPGNYIHIGGDECPKTRWEKCPKCQKRIKDEKLNDTHELQSYFVSRIEKYLNSKGKQMIGWDEILEGGLAPNAAVMSWRGTQGGIDAAKQHHYVVMTPGKPCYFDHYQAKNKITEPLAIGGYNPIDSVYAYDPTPKNLSEDEKKYIMGAQGNVWTEYIPNFMRVEYMSLPRMCALSEVLWSDSKNKNYAEFKKRLTENVKLLDKMKVNYCKKFLIKK